MVFGGNDFCLLSRRGAAAAALVLAVVASLAGARPDGAQVAVTANIASLWRTIKRRRDCLLLWITTPSTVVRAG